MTAWRMVLVRSLARRIGGLIASPLRHREVSAWTVRAAKLAIPNRDGKAVTQEIAATLS
jgi:hypothetical protein